MRTLTKVRVAKNGIVSYKEDRRRSTGTVYFDKKMFAGDPPETIQIEGAGLAELAPAAAPKPAAEAPAAEPVAEGAPA